MGWGDSPWGSSPWGSEAVTPTPPTPTAVFDRVALVEAEHVTVDCRLELLDADLRVIADISEFLEDGEVEHGNFRTIHRTISLRLARELEWGRHRVRPTMLISGAGMSDEIPLGVFALTSPERPRGESPPTFDVVGYDLLYLLDHPTDRTLRFDTSVDVLTHVRAVLAERGMPLDRLDNTAAGLTLSSPMVVPITDERSWLNVINDLLSAINYRALYMTGDGLPTSGPYRAPGDQSDVWVYDASDSRTTVSPEGSLQFDFTDTPNVWVLYRDDPSEEFVPTLDDGLVVAENWSDGPSSIEARGGLRVVRKEAVEAASHQVLVDKANRMIAEDKLILQRLAMTTSPNPYHGHFDVMTVLDPEAGIKGRWQHVSWTLPLLGGDMTHELRSVQ